jgi:hypothetical protein
MLRRTRGGLFLVLKAARRFPGSWKVDKRGLLSYSALFMQGRTPQVANTRDAVVTGQPAASRYVWLYQTEPCWYVVAYLFQYLKTLGESSHHVYSFL